MKRFHHQLLVLCALVLMFALAAGLSPAAYAEYPHLRGNKGLKADSEMAQSVQTPEPEASAEDPDDTDVSAFEEPDSITVPEVDGPDSFTVPEMDEQGSADALEDSEPDGFGASPEDEQGSADAPADSEPDGFGASPEDEPEEFAETSDEEDPDADYDNNLDDLDIEEVLQANTYESVMKNHSAFTVKTVTNPDITGYGRDGFYCGTDHYNYYEYNTEAETNGVAAILVTEQNAYRLIQFADGDTGFYVEWIADPTQVDKINKLSESCMSLDAEAFRREILIDVEDAEEGTLVITTADDTSALMQSTVQLPEDWEDGIILRTYELDSETLEIRSLAEVLMTVQDEKIPLLVQTVGYQEEQQDSLQIMLERAENYEENRFEEPREISVIYDPGTEDESVCGITIEKGDSVIPVFLDGYELYEDEAQESLYMGVDGMDDMKIYAFPLTQDEQVPGLEPYSEEDDTGLPADSLQTDELTQPEKAMPGLDSADEMSEPALDPVSPADEEFTDTIDSGEMPISGSETVSLAKEEGVSAVEPEGLSDTEEIVTDSAASPDFAAAEAEESSSAEEDYLSVGPAAEEDLSALMRDLYLANKLDLIFLNHKSVEYLCTYDFEAAQVYTGYTYETTDMAYTEDDDFAAYASDSAYYRLTMDEQGTELSYVFDFCNDYDPHLNAGYELVPEDYEDWWDEEAESVQECYEEDGILFLMTEKNEQKSREFVEDWLKADYDGEIVTAEITADAKTREVLRYAYCVEKDGVTSTPVVFEVAYDQPMPRTAKMLRAFAERDTDWTADITVVMNPGTKAEVSQTMTVPVGSTIACATDVEVNKFEDRSCTIPAEDWDGNSSQTFYLMPVTGLSARM